MNRQEFLLNLTLVTIIGALGYSIYEARRNPADLSVISITAGDSEPTDAAPATETNYNQTTADKKYPEFGNKELFRAILTPTPTPAPPPPPPPKTPDIGKVLATWKFNGADAGVAFMEDVKKTQMQAEDSNWEMRVGETKPVDGEGKVLQAKLLKIDETTDPDNPSVVVGLEGTQAEKTIRLLDDPAAAAPGPAAGAR